MTIIPTPAERNRERLKARTLARLRAATGTATLPREAYQPMPAAGGDTTRWPRPGVPGKGCLHALGVLAAGVVASWAVVLAVGLGLAKLIQAVT